MAVHDRYNRKNSIDAEILLLLAQSLNLFSSPFKKKNRLFLLFAMNINNSFIYHSLKPLKNIFKVFVNYYNIKNNRKISMYSNLPFLKIED